MGIDMDIDYHGKSTKLAERHLTTCKLRSCMDEQEGERVYRPFFLSRPFINSYQNAAFGMKKMKKRTQTHTTPFFASQENGETAAARHARKETTTSKKNNTTGSDAAWAGSLPYQHTRHRQDETSFAAMSRTVTTNPSMSRWKNAGCDDRSAARKTPPRSYHCCTSSLLARDPLH